MLHVLNPAELYFPPVETAGDDGLLAIGGDLSVERLLLAYKSAIFPWYNEYEPICWWSPDPRFVLFPRELVVSKTMQQLLKRNLFSFSINKDFKAVIKACKQVYRPGQPGTWISDEIEQAYIQLHHLGFAFSAETWLGDKLVGGLYGVKLKNVFCGESMFSLVSNASKFALIKYVQQLMQENIRLIDCQVYTPHLQSLGARYIPRSEFLKFLD